MARPRTAEESRPAAAKHDATQTTRTHLCQLDFISGDDGNWSVEVPDLPGRVAWGKTREKAVRSFHDAILLCVGARPDVGSTIPHGTTILELHDGFVPAPSSESHSLYQRSGRRPIVAFHASGDNTFKSGTLSVLLKHARWSEDDLVRLDLLRRRSTRSEDWRKAA